MKSRLHLRENLMKTFVIIKFCPADHLPDHGKCKICIFHQHFGTNLKLRMEKSRISHISVQVYRRTDSTGMAVNLIKQFSIAVILCIHIAKYMF